MSEIYWESRRKCVQSSGFNVGSRLQDNKSGSSEAAGFHMWTVSSANPPHPLKMMILSEVWILLSHDKAVIVPHHSRKYMTVVHLALCLTASHPMSDAPFQYALKGPPDQAMYRRNALSTRYSNV